MKGRNRRRRIAGNPSRIMITYFILYLDFISKKKDL